MRYIVITLFFSFFLVCCHNPNHQLQDELKQTKEELEFVKLQIPNSGKMAKGFLVHEVYFNLKDNLTDDQKQSFLNQIKTLHQISEVKNLKIGKFEFLNDPRALKDYEMIMTMEFESKKAYVKYQSHPIHLELKKATANILAAPPSTYDFIVQ